PAVGAGSATATRSSLGRVVVKAAVAEGDGRIGGRKSAPQGAAAGAARAAGVAIAAVATLGQIVHEGTTVDYHGREGVHPYPASVCPPAGAARAAADSGAARVPHSLVHRERTACHLERGELRCQDRAAAAFRAKNGPGAVRSRLG